MTTWSATRHDNEILLRTTSYGLILVYQSATLAEHNNLLQILTNEIPSEKLVDIFFEWRGVSIFMFDQTTCGKDLMKKIHDLSGKLKYDLLVDGKSLHPTKMNDMYCVLDQDGLHIGKHFMRLLKVELCNREDIECIAR